jgi:hypothetical protein
MKTWVLIVVFATTQHTKNTGGWKNNTLGGGKHVDLWTFVKEEKKFDDCIRRLKSKPNLGTLVQVLAVGGQQQKGAPKSGLSRTDGRFSTILEEKERRERMRREKCVKTKTAAAEEDLAEEAKPTKGEKKRRKHKPTKTTNKKQNGARNPRKVETPTTTKAHKIKKQQTRRDK